MVEHIRRERQVRERRIRIHRARDLNQETRIGDLFYPKCSTVVPLDFERVFFPEADILKFLGKLDYGTWVAEIHDCEDRALWGMAAIRNNPEFYGAPVGIAIDESHAVIIYWTDGRTRKYWDPATKSNVVFHPLKIIA